MYAMCTNNYSQIKHMILTNFTQHLTSTLAHNTKHFNKKKKAHKCSSMPFNYASSLVKIDMSTKYHVI